jgi:hypothetical protein
VAEIRFVADRGARDAQAGDGGERDAQLAQILTVRVVERNRLRRARAMA